MTRFLVFCAGLIAVACLHSGCGTASPTKRPPSTGGATAAPPVTAVAPVDPRAFEKRAEAEARYMAGLSHELKDEPEQALEDFYLAALADPSNEVMVLDLTTRFLFLKRHAKAAELLNKALENPGASPLLDTRLAFVLQQMGKTNEAIRANQAAIRKGPRFIGGYQGLYLLYSQCGRSNDAVAVLTQASAVPNPAADFLVDLSELYFLQQRFTRGSNDLARTRAKEALQRAGDLNPTNFFVLQKLADGFTRLGDTKRAAATLLKIQLLHPDMPNIRERLVDLYLRERDKKGASEQLEGIIREDPTNPQGYYLLGIIAFDDQRFQDAADHFRKTLLLNPSYEPAYYELAVCRMNLNQSKEALEVLAQAREKFKETFLSEYFTALAYMRQKDYTNAIPRLTAAEVIASAGQTNRLTHIFYFQFGSACERAGRWEEGAKYLRQCLQLSPEFAEALNYLGYMYAERGTNLVQARDMIEKALKQEPNNAAFLDSLGWVYYQQDQPREALKHIQRAVDLEKEPDATLYDHLGDVYRKLNEPDKARAAWEKAQKLERKAEVQKKLDALKP